MGRRIDSFRELNVYVKAFELQQKIFERSKKFPRDEVYSLTDQIRRASRSVGANIAEAWHKRRYPAHFVSKLSDADGEQAETRHWLDTAMSCGYLTTDEHQNLSSDCETIGRMLGRMLAKTRNVFQEL